MSRVEDDNESARIEQALQAKKIEAKKIDEAKSFRSQLAQTQQMSKQAAGHDASRHNQQNNANQQLMAKQGIANNSRAAKIYAEGNERSASKRTAQQASQKNIKEQATTNMQRSVKRKSSANDQDNMPKQTQHKKKDKEQTTSRGGASFDKTAALQGVAPTLAPIGGVSSKTSASGAEGTSAHTQQIIAEIVKAIRKGLTAKKIGFIDIELKDDVLSGAHMRMLHTDAGLQLSIEVGNENTERLLSASDTAHDLSLALQDKGIKLQTLEVNHRKVLG